jgi:uncharacterized protein (DUF983 family)
MITKCPKCKEGKIDYSMSELHLINDSNPQEAGIEGLCSECQAHIYVKFKEFQYEVTEFDDLLEEEEKKEIINL